MVKKSLKLTLVDEPFFFKAHQMTIAVDQHNAAWFSLREFHAVLGLKDSLLTTVLEVPPRWECKHEVGLFVSKPGALKLVFAHEGNDTVALAEWVCDMDRYVMISESKRDTITTRDGVGRKKGV